MTTPTEEDFELELRSLPGVLNVGLTSNDDGIVEMVTLVIMNENPTTVRAQAAQVANLYFPGVVIAVDVADSQRVVTQETARVELGHVDFDEVRGSCRVTVSFDGRTSEGTARSGPLSGGVEGTLDALRGLGFEIPYYLETVSIVSTVRGRPVVVAMKSSAEESELFGIAQAESESVAAARATLNALNRILTKNSESTTA